MSLETVVEKCGCGAEFTWSGNSLYGATRLRDWRANHRHIEPAKPLRLGSCCINVGTDECRCENPTNWDIDFLGLNHGVCPGCGVRKFIGHGPLCGDCFAAPQSTPTTESKE